MNKILFLFFLSFFCCSFLFASSEFLPVKTVLFEERFSTLEDIKHNWQLEEMNGGKGEIDIDYQTVTPDNSPTLCIKKTNNKGFLVVKFKRNLRTLLAGLYRIQGKYHADNATPGNFFSFRFLRGKRDPRYYEPNTNAGDVGATYSALLNSAPGKWQNFTYFFEIRENERNKEDFYIAMLLSGDKCSVNVEEVVISKVVKRKGERFANFRQITPELRFEKGSLISKEEALKYVKTRKPATIEMKRDGRNLRFTINGTQIAPVFYMLQCPNSRAHNMEMAAQGIKLHEVYCYAGGGARRGFNVLTATPGQYNFKTCENQALEVLSKAPDAVLVLRFSAGSYPGLESDPDEIWQNRDGHFGVSNSGDNMLAVSKFVKSKKNGEYYYPSYASKKWRKICADAFVAYIEHLKKTGLFNAFAGYEFEIGEDGQFFTNWSKRDYCPAVRRGFAAFLKRKYKTVENLRKAWGKPDAEFSFPTRESMPGYNGLPKKDILDPAVDMPLIDAIRYHHEMQLEMVEYFRERIEKAAGRPMWSRVMHPANLYKSWCDQIAGGETEIDGMRNCIYYTDRRPGRPAAPTVALDTARRNGKLCVEELDLRTFADAKSDSFQTDACGRATTPDMFRTILGRHTGYMIAKDMGYVFYDMNQYFAQYKEILSVIRDNITVANRIAATKNTFKPDVAVVFDSEAAYYTFASRSRSKLALRLPAFFSQYLYASGIPFDMFYMRDFLQKPIDDYKMVIFISALNLDAKGRKAIDDLKNNGRTLCFLYPAGLQGNGKPGSASQASALMGIGIKENGRTNLMMEPVGNSTLIRNVESLWGVSELLENRVWPHDGLKIPRFIVSDKNAQIIAKYITDGAPAAAVRKYSNWTSIYIGSPDGLSAGLMHNLAVSANCFVAIDKTGVNLAMRGNFISAHALRSDTYTFRFPQKGQIVNPFTGKVLAENADSVKISLSAGETVWLEQK